MTKLLRNRLLTSILFFVFSNAAALAQIDKFGYHLVYSSESPEAASAAMDLTDEELADVLLARRPLSRLTFRLLNLPFCTLFRTLRAETEVYGRGSKRARAARHLPHRVFWDGLSYIIVLSTRGEWPC